MASIISSQAVRETGDLQGHSLLIDVMPLKIVKSKTITEDAHGNKCNLMRLTGRIQYADKPNANGRIYPMGVLKEAIGSIQEDIKARRILGEFEHNVDAKVHLDRLSHVMTKVWMEGPEVFGELEVLPTIYGKELRALIESNINVGISSRAVGDMTTESIDGNEYYKVSKGLCFISWDVVAEPSVAGSYLSLMESKNRLRDNAVNTRHEHERAVLREFKNYLTDDLRRS